MTSVGAVSRSSGSLRAWRNAVMTAFALGGVAISAWGPRLPELRADLALDDAGTGVVLAGVTVGAIAGLASASALLTRFGARRAIRAMLCVIGVAVGLIGGGAGWGHSVVAAAAGFVLVGFGIGSVDVMMNVEGAALEQATQRTVMPLLHASWSAGAVLGAGIGAVCAGAGIPVQAQLLGETVLIVAAAVAAAPFIPRRVPDATDHDDKRRSDRLREWLRGWTDRRLLLIGLVMLGVELGEGTANNWLPLAVHEGHHRSTGSAAWFLVAFAVSETVVRVAAGPMVDRIGRVRAVRVTTALGVAGVLMFVLVGTGWVILLGTVLWALGVSMGFPLGMSAAADSGPRPAAQVSVVASIGYLANLAGPPVIGALSGAFGVLHSLWLVVALLAVGLVVAGALAPRAVGAAGPDRA